MRIMRLSAYTLLAVVLLLSSTLIAQHRGSSEQVRRDAEARYLEDHLNTPTQRYFESITITAEEIVNGHVVVVRGDLDIYGKVNGDVLVIWGDVTIHAPAIVNGDITSLGGRIDLLDQARVNGTMLESDWKNTLSSQKRFESYYHDRYPEDYGTLRLPSVDENFLFRYNRVEGAFLGVAIPKKLRGRSGHFGGHGFLGYGFDSGKVRYQIGVDRWLFNPYNYRTEIGFEFHELTDTQDEWRLPGFENSMAAFLLKKDFYDYFERRGYSFHLSQNVTKFVRATVAYHNDDYASMNATTNWSVFSVDDRFRVNPQLLDDAGTMRSISTSLLVDTRDDIKYTRDGWYLRFETETSHSGLGGDFEFDRYFAEVRRFQRITRNEELVIRLAVGTSQGHLPYQKSFELGGIGSLRGFGFKQFHGNRMFLSNVEYRINSEIFGDFLGLDELMFIPFFDAGMTWTGSGDETLANSFRPLALSSLKSNVGFGLGDRDGECRIDFAKRTDKSTNDFVIMFRLNQPF